MPERKHRFVSAGRYRFGNQFKETKRLPLHTSKKNYSKFTNFVFPLKQTDNGDYCNHLIQLFKLTDPISLEILKISNPDFIFINEDWIQNVKYKVMMDDIIRLELIKGFSMSYTHTLFGKMETFMQNLDIDFLFPPLLATDQHP